MSGVSFKFYISTSPDRPVTCPMSQAGSQAGKLRLTELWPFALGDAGWSDGSGLGLGCLTPSSFCRRDRGKTEEVWMKRSEMV